MLRVLCTLLLSTAALPAQVVVVEAPVRGQLYARDLATNQANVPVIGVVRTPGMSRMHLLVARGGVAWSSATVDLAYAGGEAPFSFSAPIDAGWHDYTFELRLEGGGSNRSLGKIRGVVCGDAFLVNGQSNAVASDYHAEGLGNTSQSRWIRSYGSSTFYASQVTLDTEWHLADGNGQYAAGAVGAWALRAAELLVNRYQVPIALLNGAVGGTTLFQHQRNDADPEDLNTIYGRLLYRSRLSGLRDKARAMLWHQGESDGGTAPAAFTAAYGALRDDWLADYPALKQVFVFQIRDGCGVSGMGIREALREFPDVFADLTALSTTAINDHDGCHFYYAGYRKMGEWMAGAVAAVLYGANIPAAAAPPNLDFARFTSAVHDEIELVFRNPQQALVFPAGIENRFALTGGPETVVAATTSPGRILLQLSAPTAATAVAYLGGIGTRRWITNTFGVGAFTFEVPILP